MAIIEIKKKFKVGLIKYECLFGCGYNHLLAHCLGL